MGYKIFISHSIAPEDLGIVYAMAQRANQKGISTLVAERAFQLDESVSKRNMSVMRNCDSVVVFVTRGNSQGVQWVHQEIGAAQALHKLIIPIVESGVPVAQLGVRKHVPLDRQKLWESIRKAVKFIESQKIKKEQSNLLASTVIGGLLLLVFLGSGKK